MENFLVTSVQIFWQWKRFSKALDDFRFSKALDDFQKHLM